MNGGAHIIDIDSIVLTGVSLHRGDSLRASIERAVARRLREAGLPQPLVAANHGISVAGEVAHSVTQVVRGRES
ncbi:MAG: hypothetical protein ACREOC_03405 [Gemmatimonadales bacterium]